MVVGGREREREREISKNIHRRKKHICKKKIQQQKLRERDNIGRQLKDAGFQRFINKPSTQNLKEDTT
jgi:hypothetical protein